MNHFKMIKEVVLAAVRRDFNNLLNASLAMKNDKGVVVAAVESQQKHFQSYDFDDELGLYEADEYEYIQYDLSFIWLLNL